MFAESVHVIFSVERVSSDTDAAKPIWLTDSQSLELLLFMEKCGLRRAELYPAEGVWYGMES